MDYGFSMKVALCFVTMPRWDQQMRVRRWHTPSWEESPCCQRPLSMDRSRSTSTWTTTWRRRRVRREKAQSFRPEIRRTNLRRLHQVHPDQLCLQHQVVFQMMSWWPRRSVATTGSWTTRRQSAFTTSRGSVSSIRNSMDPHQKALMFPRVALWTRSSGMVTRKRPKRKR